MAERTIRGRHVLWGFIGFFGVIAAVNAVFVYLALSSYSGLHTDGAYHKGLQYNERLQAAEAQKERGWTLELSSRQSGQAALTLSAAFNDRYGTPLAGLELQAELRRPAREDLDQNVVLKHSSGGVYLTEVTLPLKGQWDMILVARQGGEVAYVAEKRLWLE